MRSILVKEIMSKDPVTVSDEDTLFKVNRIFEENKIHHIPVLRNDKLIGIISSTDFERSKVGKSLFVNHTIKEQNETLLKVTLVGTVMTKKVMTISAEDTLKNAYNVFKKKSFRSLPVTQGDKVVGIITPMDFLDFYFNQTNSNG